MCDLEGTEKGLKNITTILIDKITGTNFGTKADRILVVGAHWDTVSNSPGNM